MKLKLYNLSKCIEIEIEICWNSASNLIHVALPWRVWMCVYVCECVCVGMHTYIHKHIHSHTLSHTHTHTYTHTYTHKERKKKRKKKGRRTTSRAPSWSLSGPCSHHGCLDGSVVVHACPSFWMRNTFYSERTHSIVREHIPSTRLWLCMPAHRSECGTHSIVREHIL